MEQEPEPEPEPEPEEAVEAASSLREGRKGGVRDIRSPGLTTNFAIAPVVEAPKIASLTATPATSVAAPLPPSVSSKCLDVDEDVAAVAAVAAAADKDDGKAEEDEEEEEEEEDEEEEEENGKAEEVGEEEGQEKDEGGEVGDAE